MTYLSPDAMRAARSFMAADQQGVRDEIGFLAVHQRYADRFFPGTSVLHTRLRYVLFVPWLYHDLHLSPPTGRSTRDSMKDREYRLTGRLMGESGVIGSRNYPDPVEQSPSQVYWSALHRWGILREDEGGGSLSRHQVERLVARKRLTPLKDDEGRPLSAVDWPFTCPDPPDEWRKQDKGVLKFRLLKAEKRFLAERLRSLASPNHPGEKSVLARLVGKDVRSTKTAWGHQVLQVAGSERAALVRAGQAAALAAIGRAIYAAQLEILQEKEGVASSKGQRLALRAVVAQWARPAAKLDWAAFCGDMQSRFPAAVSNALQLTLNWVVRERTDPSELELAYRDAEVNRKGRRARLSDSQFGHDLRTEWVSAEHPKAQPLHYRWGRVQTLLADLVGA